jgi:ABC-2 type transport system permease protein
MLAAFRGEMFKVVRRPAVWVCIILLVLLAVLLGYVLFGFIYSHPPKGSSQGLPKGATLAIFLVTLYPINFIRTTLSTWADLGGVFALIIGVLVQGSEFGWGTVKVLYTQRAGRLTMLTGKLLALAVAVLVMVVALLAADAASSFVVTSLVGGDTTFPTVDVIAKGVGATFLIYGFWAVLGLTLATVFRQSAMAIGIGLAYALVVERLIFGLLSITGSGWVNDIHQWFPIANTGYLVESFGAVRIRGIGNVANPFAGPTHAVTMLLIYLAAFVVITAWFSRTRDITA